MMKTYLILAILALFVACNSQPATQTSSQPAAVVINDQDVQTLTDLKIVSFKKAYEEQDTVLLNEILHDSYQLVDDGGEVYSKNDEMAYVAQYGPSYETFTYDILSLEVYENGTASMFGKGTITGSDIEGNYTQSYKETDVFVKEEGTWRAVTTHVSGVKEIRE